MSALYYLICLRNELKEIYLYLYFSQHFKYCQLIFKPLPRLTLFCPFYIRYRTVMCHNY